MQSELDAFLVLEDGTIFKGKSIGFIGTSIGEICFNTGMTGYQEIFTDPSYFKQTVVMTNVHIGNYGIKESESESNSIKISGLICKNLSESYSRILANEGIQEYLSKNRIVGISEVDTRQLVLSIREKGAMNVIISSDGTSISNLKKLLKKAPSMEGLELASKVSTIKDYELGDFDSDIKIAVLDLGVKKNILNNLVKLGCHIKVFPSNTKFEDLNKWNPTGFFLSNGPGDPSAMKNVIENCKKIIATNKPIFGICLGHQIIALSQGIGTYKMKHGHRGINHPVIHLKTGKSEITSQNHGFGIKKEDVLKNKNIKITHVNLNDDSVEGIEIIDKNVFSVQYHPEASPGPHDSNYLFNEFLTLLK